MKKIFYFLLLVSFFQQICNAQNVGIGNTNPQAKLDIAGDVRLRSTLLTLPAGLNNNVDINTVKSSVYMFAGGALGGCQITGFSAGVDGRFITIFNNSTTAAIQLYDESNSTNTSAAANKILTGTGNSAIVYQNGSVTLRYDGAKQRWTVVSSNFTDGLTTGGSSTSGWGLSGNAGTTAANFIGTTDDKPLIFKTNATEALRIQPGGMTYIGATNINPANTMLYINGNMGIAASTINSLQSGGAITTINKNPIGFSDVLNIDGTTIQSSSISQGGSDISPLLINPFGGNVGIGTTVPTNKLTINNTGIGLSQQDTTGVVKVGFYTSANGAYLQTHTNTDLNFSTNNGLPQMVLKTTGNVGIGTTTPTAKLDVAGGVRISESATALGTIIKQVQAGHVIVGSNPTNQLNPGLKRYTLVFPNSFNSPPHLVITPRTEQGQSYIDTFGFVVQNITTTSAEILIQRLPWTDKIPGWNQQLELDWIAFSF